VGGLLHIKMVYLQMDISHGTNQAGHTVTVDMCNINATTRPSHYYHNGVSSYVQDKLCTQIA